MMTNEEILKEAKASFELEGLSVTGEDEERAMSCLTGVISFEDMKKKIIENYTNK